VRKEEREINHEFTNLERIAQREREGNKLQLYFTNKGEFHEKIGQTQGSALTIYDLQK
jgi:hypothetical protein